MDHRALLGAAGTRIHLPGLGSGRHQHAACRGSRPAQRLEERTHRVGAACELEPDKRVTIELVVGGRMFDVDFAQIEFELLGDQHRQRSVGPLAHLDLRHHQRHQPFAVDADESVRGEAGRRLGSPPGGVQHGRQGDGQGKAAPEGGTGVEEATAEPSRGPRPRALGKLAGMVRSSFRSRRGGSRRGCADTYRSGRHCRPWRRRCRHRSASACRSAAPRPT